VLANTAWDSGAAITGDLKLQTAPACCEEGKTCWTGTASHTKSLTVPLPVSSATVNFTVDATVTWQGIPQDPTGTVFQPTGTLSVGPLTGSVGDCTMMAPVETFPITPDLGQLQLFFTPGQPPQYTGTGSSPGAASWPLTIDCPPDEGGSSTLPIAVPVWFLTGQQQWDDPTFDTIKGQHTGDGDTFTWNFTRVGD
jgi:hypothetical protein